MSYRPVRITRAFVVLSVMLTLTFPTSQPADGRAPVSAVRKVGVLMAFAESDPQARVRVMAFRNGLQALGWTEGANLRLDIRWGTNDPGSMQRSAKELVALQPDVILSHNTPTTATLLQQTRSIPIVFATVSDPVGSGFVASFARPGGNVTGFTNIEPAMAGKWLDLLKQIAPRIVRTALLFNPSTAPYADAYFDHLKAAAMSLGMEASATPVRSAPEIEAVIAAHARTANSGLVVMTDSFLVTHRAEIIAQVARHRLPTIYPFHFFVEAGGLVSYGNDLIDDFRRAAGYADRILMGVPPTDLPVQAPVKFELVINQRTARAQGLMILPSLLGHAHRILE